MTDVFLSYSSNDRAAAKRVVEALEKAGYRVFWDQKVPPGRDWNQWIGEKLAQGRIAVVLWSKTSVKSDNVVHEATIAKNRGKLIPAVVESLKPEEFPMGFYTLQAADLRTREGLTQLVAAVRERLGAGARPEPEEKRRQAGGDSKAMLVAGALALLALAGGGFWLLTRGAGAPAEALPGPTLVDPAQRLAGAWRWDGIACGEGPNVSIEGGEIAIAMTGVETYRHVVDRMEGDTVHTVLLAPEAQRGAEYALTRRGDQLEVKTVADGATDTWEACR